MHVTFTVAAPQLVAFAGYVSFFVATATGAIVGASVIGERKSRQAFSEVVSTAAAPFLKYTGAGIGILFASNLLSRFL